jgi:hypothetical protein
LIVIGPGFAASKSENFQWSNFSGIFLSVPTISLGQLTFPDAVKIAGAAAVLAAARH